VKDKYAYPADYLVDVGCCASGRLN